MSYQRVVVSTGANVGAPGPLPEELMGLSDATLANLPAALPEATLAQLGYTNAGFLPVADPPPATPRIISHYDFLNRFTSAERVAIRGSTDGAVVDLMDMMREAAAVNLDDAATQQGVSYLASLGLIGAARPAAILA